MDGTGHTGTVDVSTCVLNENDWIQKGEKDPLGDKVERVLVGTDKFLIYSVVQGGSNGPEETPEDARKPIFPAESSHSNHVWLRTKYPKNYDCARDLRASLAPIAAELAYNCDVVDSICRSNTLDANSSSSLRRRASEMMARAMAMAYEGNKEGATELLGHLRTNVTTLRDSRNRMRYVQGNGVALIFILLLWCGLQFFGVFPELTLPWKNPDSKLIVHVFDVLALGALGAFFAVSASIGSIRVDHSVTLWEMVYTGFIRIPIGVIAAGVAIFLISGGWLLASIGPDYLPWTFLLFGFIAGFSELFVPNALRQVESASTVSAPDGGA